MLRSLAVLLLLFTISADLGAARKKKRKAAKVQPRTEQTAADKKAKPAQEPVQPAAITEEKISDTAVSSSSEMDVYRAIQKRGQCTVQDLADLMLMYRGEFAKIKTPEKRLARLRELKIIKNQKGNETLERGTLAYAIMQVYHPESGLFFWLTGWERYAMRDVQEAGIMPNKASSDQFISGEQLMGTITAAEEYTEAKKKWGK